MQGNNRIIIENDLLAKALEGFCQSNGIKQGAFEKFLVDKVGISLPANFQNFNQSDFWKMHWIQFECQGYIITIMNPSNLANIAVAKRNQVRYFKLADFKR